MASKYKSPSDVELVAIYRLEFYKKQKNWKFCQDVCKKKAPEPSTVPVKEGKRPMKSAISTKSTLNKTYDLEPEVEPSNLNNAFLEHDLDKIPPGMPPHHLNPPPLNHTCTDHSVTQQKWPDTQQKCSDAQQRLAEIQHQWPEAWQQWPETEQQEKQWPDVDKKWPEATRVWTVPDMPEQGWQNVGQEWGGEEAYCPQDVDTLRCYETDRGWPEPLTEANVYAEDQPEALLGAAEDWLRTLHCPAGIEDAQSQSMDSVISFMRGAAAAPHSSEVDLNVTDSGDTYLNSAVACLSQRELAAAVSRHANALKRLLREATARATIEQHRSRPTLSGDYRTPNVLNLSYEERPTRDIDLFPPKDSFIAGSFKNNESFGRGRGRLHRERLIGIGMGRPYRL